MLDIWSQRSGYNFGTFEERRIINITLPTTSVPIGITFTIISGSLPSGLRIDGNRIVGTAYEVSRITESRFVIRAADGTSISDRTFYMTIEGADAPEWVTPEGRLPVNPNGLTYVLDNTYIDYQLSAVDRDLPAGDTLEFFIDDDGGELPPGLTLSTDGKITGIIDPILALDISAGTGFFDSNFFDSAVFDFGRRPTTGFETFLYDTLIFDYSAPEITPRKLNRNYVFEVSVSDGETIVKRKFTIYVVGDDFLRADNTIIQIGDGAFTADNTYLRAPFWLTGRNLGIKRANNNITVFLEAYDANPDVGPVYYEIAAVNDDSSPSVLPPGLFVDSTNGELFGYVPYQPAVTKNYKFSVSVIKIDSNSVTETEVSLVVRQRALIGQSYLIVNPLPADDIGLIVGTIWRLGNSAYTVIGYEGVDDINTHSSTTAYPGGTVVVLDTEFYIALRDVPASVDGILITDSRYWELTTVVNFGRILLSKPLIQDVPVSQPGDAIRKIYTQSTLEFNTVKSTKTFEIAILGEVDSVIRWITPLDLGIIKPNFISTKFIEAETSVPGAVLQYSVVGGRLPPGLELSKNGNIAGKVKQYGEVRYRSVWRSGREYAIGDVVKINTSGTASVFYKAITDHSSGLLFDIAFWIPFSFQSVVEGLTIIDGGELSFDGRSTSIGRTFNISIIAQDQFQYSAIVGTFTITVDAADPVNYSNIIVRPFLKTNRSNSASAPQQRELFSDFINDSNIFTPTKIYRQDDPNFGVQKDLKMLLYAGIETVEAKFYALALTKNAKRKRFQMGQIKKAIARDLNTNEIIYEVIYIDVIDNQELGNKSAPRAVRTTTRTNTKVNQDFYDNALGNLETTENQNKLNDPLPNKFRSINDTVKVNNNAVTVGNLSFYPTSVSNIRKNIAEIQKFQSDGSTRTTVLTENEFLPLWMLTPQDKFTAATGFVKAVPLCYCIPGEGQFILDNIKNNGFNFTDINYEIDRLIIDAVEGRTEDRYLKFPNYEFNV
jgi:hypothetical protein